MNGRINLLFRKIAATLFFGSIRGNGWKRRRVAAAWLSGSGIEIGALHNPLPVPNTVRVTYLDRMNNSELLRQYPELSEKIWFRLISLTTENRFRPFRTRPGTLSSRITFWSIAKIRLELPFSMRGFIRNGGEVIVILKKTAC